MIVNFVVFHDNVPFLFPSNGKHLALLSSELHCPLPFPELKFREVILYEVRVSIRVYDSVQNAVVGKEPRRAHQSLGQVVYIYEEQGRSEDSALRYARGDWCEVRLLAIDHYYLSSSMEEVQLQ